jgi:gamma-glutamyl:cysteine ligase YbdK (ATP-grasp superfamily)
VQPENQVPRPLPLFAGHGIEIEYMIVDRERGDVLPLTDRVLHAVAGAYVEEVERGDMAWSNELVLHVIELKTSRPAVDLTGVGRAFQRETQHIDALLAPLGAALMPTAMHPWMDPARETHLWPHGYSEIYAAFDRIFGCSGHGWSNLQSTHINLPFADDGEFELLHAAIRLLLPILPALAASSPLAQGELTGWLDTRLEMYRHNARRIPSVTGLVVPEPVRGRAEYERLILAPMYADVAPHDPDGVLRHEWLNARGAIARFDRNTVEIRVLDTQECPAQDLAIAQGVTAVLRALVQGGFAPLPAQHELATGALARILGDCARSADLAVIDDRAFLRAFAFPERRGQARELWQHLFESLPATAADTAWRPALEFIVARGCLARRIVDAVGPGARRASVRETYRVLCDCLARGERFEGID